MCIVEGVTLDDLMHRVFEMVLKDGSRQQSTRGKNLELMASRLALQNPRARLSQSESRRKPVSAIAELCWYLSGSDSVDAIASWLPKYREEAEEDGRVHGAYGPRLFGAGNNDQFRRMFELLSVKPGTRRAVIQLFDRNDIARNVQYKDVPCTATMQFLLRSNQLNVVVNMRSNDVYMGLPHDIFAFTMLQEIMARELNVEIGCYVHFVGSLHLYDHDESKVQHYLEEGWQSTKDSMPPMPMGSQMPHVAELLQAEDQLRNGVRYKDVAVPRSPYWADLVRLLAIHSERKQGVTTYVSEIIDDIVNDTIRKFARASEL